MFCRYDRLAFRYLSPPLVLLVVGYSLWSLVFHFHRGWYAWLLESLVALVYGCGFSEKRLLRKEGGWREWRGGKA